MNSTSSLTIVIIAIFSLLMGLFLLIWFHSRSKNKQFYVPIGWLLITLFPVLIIFAYFPTSSASGTVFNITLSGAIAAFGAIWIYGTRFSLKIAKAEDLEIQIQELKIQIQELERKSQESQKQQAPESINHTEKYFYRLKTKRSKKIGLATGDIDKVDFADVWVSSENTNMQMARYYDLSVSGTIRYHGAVRNRAGDVLEDIIHDELKEKMIEIGSKRVEPATVIVTGAGELQKEKKVKKIFHVASVNGQVGIGYRSITNIGDCVRNSLREADSADWRDLTIKTILFPLLGTGTGRGDLRDNAQKMIQAAISYLETTANSTIECVYFLTRTRDQLEICQAILDTSDKLIKS